MRDRLLIVDDDIGIRMKIRWGLGDRFDVVEAEDPESAMARFHEFKPAVVTLDIRLSGHDSSDGMSLLSTMLVEDPSVCVIMVTADTDERIATRAMELGAWDYHTKPIVTARLTESAVRAARVRRIQEVTRYPREVLVSATDFESWLGTSPLARRFARTLEGLASAQAPVLIVGEPGTGREIAARALHELSPSPDTFFMQIDCTAGLPDFANLPDRATVFFDEVTSLDPRASSRLAEWLVDTGGRRVIASAPFDPSSVSGGDGAPAYDYAGMLTVVLPPLRAHPEDIPALAERLLAILGGSTSRELHLSPDACTALVAHRWTSNFRELEKRLLGAALLADGDVLRASDFWPEPEETDIGDLRQGLADRERTMIVRALGASRGNVSEAARRLGVSRQSLHARLGKHGIEPDDYRDADAR